MSLTFLIPDLLFPYYKHWCLLWNSYLPVVFVNQTYISKIKYFLLIFSFHCDLNVTHFCYIYALEKYFCGRWIKYFWLHILSWDICLPVLPFRWDCRIMEQCYIKLPYLFEFLQMLWGWKYILQFLLESCRFSNRYYQSGWWLFLDFVQGWK